MRVPKDSLRGQNENAYHVLPSIEGRVGLVWVCVVVVVVARDEHVVTRSAAHSYLDSDSERY